MKLLWDRYNRPSQLYFQKNLEFLGVCVCTHKPINFCKNREKVFSFFFFNSKKGKKAIQIKLRSYSEGLNISIVIHINIEIYQEARTQECASQSGSFCGKKAQKNFEEMRMI